MKPQVTITILAAVALALASISAIAQERQQGARNGARAQERAQVERGCRDFGGARIRKRDRISNPERDRIRDQDRASQPDEDEASNQGDENGG